MPINVYVDGVFDLFHEGHINFLKKASSFGRLIAGVHNDKFVGSYKRQPIMPEKSRYAVVKGCKYIDETIEGAGILSEEILKDFEIGLVLHGDDFTIEQARKYYKVAIDKGIFQYVSYTRGISSTQIINSIKERFEMNGTLLL